MLLRATSHTRLRARDHFKQCHWWKRQRQSKFASQYALGTNGVYKGIQDGCEVYMDSYMASNGSCFMVTWIIFRSYLLEVGLTQNRYSGCSQPSGFVLFMTSHYTWGYVTTLHDVGGVLGQLLDTFFWALTISWSRLLARVWNGPNFLSCPSFLQIDLANSRKNEPSLDEYFVCFLYFLRASLVALGKARSKPKPILLKWLKI